MSTYHYEGYTLSLKNTYRQDRYGHYLIRYSLRGPDNRILFRGADFGASPLHAPTGKMAACALIDFLTQNPDTSGAGEGFFTDENGNDFSHELMQWLRTDAENIGWGWRETLGDPDL